MSWSGFRPLPAGSDISATCSAVGLRTERSRLIGVVVPDMANLVFAPILSAIETVLAKNGYSALIANAGGDVEQQIRIVDQLIAHRVEGSRARHGPAGRSWR